MGFFDFKIFLNRILSHNDEFLLRKALSLIPLDDLNNSTIQKLRVQQKNALADNRNIDEAAIHEMIFLQEFLQWFKNDFFKWFDVPMCTVCHEPCRLIDVQHELQGPINKSEVFQCFTCFKVYVFHRYVDSNMLLESRCGRCHEYAQVCALMFKALKYDTRVVFDVTDHIWNEVYSHLQRRWIHCDPSEGIVDKPLIYEKGWNKTLSYIVAIGETGIQDVTSRYTSDHAALLLRRSADFDISVVKDIVEHQKCLLADSNPIKARYLIDRYIRELVELMVIVPQAEGSYEARQSGSMEWRVQRKEIESMKIGSNDIGHVFKYNPPEDLCENVKLVSLCYSANKDAYLFSDHKSINELKLGWNSCAFSFQNIKLKKEYDWRNSYLARERNNGIGHLGWKFDLTGSKFSIKNIYILTNFFVCETGTATCVVSNDKNSFSCGGETKDCYFDKFISSKSVNIDITLNGGTGSNSWQHAQFARQSLEEGTKSSFGIILYLIKDQNTV